MEIKSFFAVGNAYTSYNIDNHGSGYVVNSGLIM